MARKDPANEPAHPIPNCRLCLVTPPDCDLAVFPAMLASALAGGDVASIIITGEGENLQRIAESLIPVTLPHETAAVVLGDTRIAGRARADGVHIEKLEDVPAAMEAFRGKRIVGIGGIRSRHEAMGAGEFEPDYLFFGRLDGDRDAPIYPRSLDLASWWSGLFEIPAIVMGGRAIESVTEAANASIEFVALGAAVWEHADGPAAAVAAANRILLSRESA